MRFGVKYILLGNNLFKLDSSFQPLNIVLVAVINKASFFSLEFIDLVSDSSVFRILILLCLGFSFYWIENNDLIIAARGHRFKGVLGKLFRLSYFVTEFFLEFNRFLHFLVQSVLFYFYWHKISKFLTHWDYRSNLSHRKIPLIKRLFLIEVLAALFFSIMLLVCCSSRLQLLFFFWHLLLWWD